MVVATLLWSMAGVVTRHLDSAGGFEATFWRSAFNAAALVVLLARLRGVSALKKTLLSADPTLWLSGLCWAVMFTAFMVAITMTTVANVLVTMAIAPLLTALVARVVIGQRLPPRTWAAIVVAGAGIAWMYAHELAVVDARQLAGTAVALAVPIAAALNWTAIQRSRGGSADLLAAVLIGALLSSLLTWPLAAPLAANAHDVALLALLGIAQLAIPCLIAVAAARVLAAPEVALLSLLEIIFGVTWTWLGAAEAPSRHVVEGGALVLGALVANESIALRQRRAVANATRTARRRRGRRASPPGNMTSHSALHHPTRMSVRRSRSSARRGVAEGRDDPRPPNAVLMLLEGRAPIEFLSLFAALPWLARLPRGDGHPVMVFPGMAASDITTMPLRRYLAGLGYVTRAWGQGLNFGPRPGVLERSADDLRALADKHGQPVSLIGWSLGGIYARELAKLHPAETRCVVTLGTPFTGHPKATNAWRIYELLSRSKVGDAELMAEIRKPPPVPTTSIYSRSDGIVSWRCSLNDAGPLVENIEVPASHVGMGTNPLVLYAVADRLAQPIGQWRRFDVSGARRWFFRTALPDAMATAG